MATTGLTAALVSATTRNTLKSITTLSLILTLALTSTSLAGEREEQARLAPKYHAEIEVVLWDQTRVDLLNDEYAIEIDFSVKWAEAVGQSLYYAALTDRKPAIILLIKDFKKETRNIFRCQLLCELYKIKLYLEPVE
jgi:hypothetical protein